MWIGPRTLAWLVAAAIIFGACTTDDGAPESQQSSAGRAVPRFSNPTRITNRYLPFGERGRWIYEGTKGKKPYLIEVAVTEATKTVRWGESATETMVVRRRSWVRGRLIEEAFDYYGQGDDGGVWNFGESVDNYRGSEVINQDGSWLAGADGAEPTLFDQALTGREENEARHAALDLEQTVLDLVRLYQTERPVDLDVLDLYVRRIDAAVDDGDHAAAATAAAMAWGVSERSSAILPGKVERAAAAVDEAADKGELTNIFQAASRLRAAIR